MRRLQNIKTSAFMLGVLILMMMKMTSYQCSAKSISISTSSSLSTTMDNNNNNYDEMSSELSGEKTTEYFHVPHKIPREKFYQLPRRKMMMKMKMNNTQRILSRTDRSVDLVQSNNSLSGIKRVKNSYNKAASILERNERSTNLSHIAGSTRRIQLYIKNRFLQILPDGTINGTTDDSSEYTIVQRTTVNVGQIKIQALATCLFLCMDACGNTYGSAQFNDDCVFNESIEQHHYNTYSSTFHSNDKRKLYLALNRHGQTRKVILPSTRQLGKLSTYTNSLTHPISHERVNKLLEMKFGSNHGRHSLKQLCESGKVLNEDVLKPKLKCDSKVKLSANNNKKRKNQQQQKCASSDQESDVNNYKNCTLNLNSNSAKNDQSIKISDKKKQQSAQNARKCHPNKQNKNNNNNNNEKKPAKNNNNKTNNSSNVKVKSSDIKCFERNKMKQRKRKRKKIITTTPKSDDLDLKIIATNGNDEENFASDEIESEEDEYDAEIPHNPLTNFVANNYVYEDN